MEYLIQYCRKTIKSYLPDINLIQYCRKTIKSYLLDVNFYKLKVEGLQFRMERLLVIVRDGGRFMEYI